MKILFLAPQPFFQDRGTPIAVRLAVQVLATRGTDQIDLLTYHEGKEIEIPQVSQHRIPALPGLNGIGAGISLKKLLCDVVFLFTALRMVWTRRHDQYDLVHAVEESVFIALLIKWIFGVPYIYDMDSSLAMQVTEKWFLLKPLYPFLALFEKLAVRQSAAVVPVCDALETLAVAHGAEDTQILRDISLLDMNEASTDSTDLRTHLNLPGNSVVVLYIGNLEPYQGVDLLFESFAQIAAQQRNAHLVVIGGLETHVENYQARVNERKLGEQIHFLGPRPVASLAHYLKQADILASPRTRGNNTPMKIYSYLHSGRAVIATRLPTHTQVMDDSMACLVAPGVGEFSAGLQRLINDAELRALLGATAHRIAEERYTFTVFQRSLNSLYDRIDSRLGAYAVLR